MNELVKSILIFIPISFIIFLAGIYLGGEVWTKGKIVLGDILALFGWVSKKVRKLSVESEYEGTINSIIKDYNKNFESPILPNCKIQWVTVDNKQNILKENEAIVCLSFDKKDHNLNFYNATLNFVQTGLIAKAKDYLSKSSSTAIDLLTTHIILRNNRKEVLTTFRKKMKDFDEETKREFEILTPTNDKGIFLNILLPEFHYYGELIDTLPPNSEYNIEASGLLNWFTELATREFDERTNLKYISKNFKVGVILVGKDETWESQGASAYTKWADFYATENYNSVYILARGSNGYERATTVANILTSSKGFDQLNKNPKIKCVSPEGQEYIVTCYSLRPNRAKISYLAWESFKEYNANGEPVPAIIDTVQKETIIVNVFGLKVEISKKYLSEIEISDARKVFKNEDELYLNIIEFNPEQHHIVLSNKGTISDPKHYIDAVLNKEMVYSCRVEKVQTDRGGLQIGLKVSNSSFKNWLFIPTHNATASRFLDLNSKFPIGSLLDVKIQRYASTTSNFIGSLIDLKDPWDSEKFRELRINDVLNVEVKQINEFTVICEIVEGLECRFARQEISWVPQECVTSSYKIDDKIDVKILAIDEDRKRIETSIKRLVKTPELEFYDANLDKIVEVEVVRVVPDIGIAVKYEGGTNRGFIHFSEIGYGYVGRFENIFNPSDKIQVVLSAFDADKNSLKFSVKKQYKHQFDEWFRYVNVDEPVRGKVIRYFDRSVQIELVANGFTVQSYIAKKFISNLAFVENEDLPYYLPIGETFDFYILGMDDKRKTISLTRKDYFDQFDLPEYGDKIRVTYVKENHSKAYFYSNDFEGWINLPEENIQLGSKLDVIIVSQSTGEFCII
ncbi:S1 RNA-binding domain-containing protein [Sphingobacterium multivorum]|uniref:S1 RNA-binding domain-containing protein n=1 Tax=Sphingobacterium multivorum TaxID=28454 RepID=UPI0028B22435|nr:S1 RNA-binding domain-containing protein [Sphingobacterium multivorum]